MKLMNPEDFDALAIVWQMAYGEDNPQHQDLIDRMVATKEYLSRVEFATPEEIEVVRKSYGWDDDAIQVDDDARVSRGDDGTCWVGVWVLIKGKDEA